MLSNESSLDHAVIKEESAFKQIEKNGSTFFLFKPPSNSADRCSACAALPPFPHHNNFFSLDKFF